MATTDSSSLPTPWGDKIDQPSDNNGHLLHLLRDAVLLVVGNRRRAVVRLVVLALLDEVGGAGAVVHGRRVDVRGQDVLLLVDVLEEEPLYKRLAGEQNGSRTRPGR